MVEFVKVADVMNKDIQFVGGVETVQFAIEEMKRLGISSLVIEKRDEHDEFGLITAYNIARFAISQNRSTERTSIYEAMSKPAMTIESSMQIKYAIRLMTRLNVNRALVLEANQLKGIVTLGDLVFAYKDSDHS